MSILIRSATTEDTQGIQRVATESWHATYEGIIPRAIQNNFLAYAYSEAVIEHRTNTSLFLVAEKDHEVVGFANFTTGPETKVAELAALYMIPTAQREGIGTALLNAGMQKLFDACYIELTVEKENTQGQLFYKSQGFYVTEEFEENLEGHMLQSIRMERKLS